MAPAQIVGNGSSLLAVILENSTTTKRSNLWRKIANAQYTYLFDEHGNGPLTPAALLADIFSLHDDPFRSPAWGVRKDGGFVDTAVPDTDSL